MATTAPAAAAAPTAQAANAVPNGPIYVDTQHEGNYNES